MFVAVGLIDEDHNGGAMAGLVVERVTRERWQRLRLLLGRLGGRW